MKNKFILEIICLMLFFPIHAGAWTVQNEIRNDRTSISLQWVQTSFAGCFESLPSSVWSERLIPRKVEGEVYLGFFLENVSSSNIAISDVSFETFELFRKEGKQWVRVYPEQKLGRCGISLREEIAPKTKMMIFFAVPSSLLASGSYMIKSYCNVEHDDNMLGTISWLTGIFVIPKILEIKSYGDTTGHEGILECTGIVADESSRTPQFYLSVVLKNETDHPLQVPLTGYTGPLNVDMNFRLVEVMENHEKIIGEAGRETKKEDRKILLPGERLYIRSDGFQKYTSDAHDRKFFNPLNWKDLIGKRLKVTSIKWSSQEFSINRQGKLVKAEVKE